MNGENGPKLQREQGGSLATLTFVAEAAGTMILFGVCFNALIDNPNPVTIGAFVCGVAGALLVSDIMKRT